MEIIDKEKKICIVRPEFGPVNIEMFVSKSIIAGANFKLFDENKIYEEFNISADEKIPGSYSIYTVSPALNKKNLLWQIVFCAKDPRISTGKIKLKLFQENYECITKPSVEWELNNVPPCIVNVPNKITASLIFVVKK